jgi:pyruvate formate lyase activating enzyme
MLGYVHSVESMTALDGLGLRAMIFLHGCPLRCLFCSNPDTWYTHKEEPVSSDSIITQISKFKGYIDGITVSGGDPLIQPEFTSELFKGAHRLGLTTALDTSGVGNKHAWDLVLPESDYVLFCIKSLDEKMYEKITSHKQKTALHFGDELALRNIPYNLRYVILSEYTDRKSDIDKLIEYAKKQPTLKAIELLPYHRLGLSKWKDLGLKYPLEGMNVPTEEKVREIIDHIRESGLKVII